MALATAIEKGYDVDDDALSMNLGSYVSEFEGYHQDISEIKKSFFGEVLSDDGLPIEFVDKLSDVLYSSSNATILHRLYKLKNNDGCSKVNPDTYCDVVLDDIWEKYKGSSSDVADSICFIFEDFADLGTLKGYLSEKHAVQKEIVKLPVKTYMSQDMDDFFCECYESISIDNLLFLEDPGILGYGKKEFNEHCRKFIQEASGLEYLFRKKDMISFFASVRKFNYNDGAVELREHFNNMEDPQEKAFIFYDQMIRFDNVIDPLLQHSVRVYQDLISRHDA